MIAFFTTLLRLFLQAFRSKGNVLSENALLKEGNEILLRKMGKKRAHFNFYDKLFLVVLKRAADIKHRLTLVKPETLLSWQRSLLKRFWTFEHRPAPRGRKPVDADVKNLIISMKNDNLLWGVKRIQGELLKLDMSLSTKAIRKILQAFRRRGKIRSSLTWKKFLGMQIRFIYAMDFFTVDTMLGKRLDVIAIISHKTWEIIQFANPENPTREFVRQQLMLFSERIASKVYFIHDPAMRDVDVQYQLSGLQSGIGQNRRGSAEHEQHHGTVF